MNAKKWRNGARVFGWSNPKTTRPVPTPSLFSLPPHNYRCQRSTTARGGDSGKPSAYRVSRMSPLQPTGLLRSLRLPLRLDANVLDGLRNREKATSDKLAA